MPVSGATFWKHLLPPAQPVRGQYGFPDDRPPLGTNSPARTTQGARFSLSQQAGEACTPRPAARPAAETRAPCEQLSTEGRGERRQAFPEGAGRIPQKNPSQKHQTIPKTWLSPPRTPRPSILLVPSSASGLVLTCDLAMDLTTSLCSPPLLLSAIFSLTSLVLC